VVEVAPLVAALDARCVANSQMRRQGRFGDGDWRTSGEIGRGRVTSVCFGGGAHGDCGGSPASQWVNWAKAQGAWWEWESRRQPGDLATELEEIDISLGIQFERIVGSVWGKNQLPSL
jgi:hypothetical protein